MIGEEEVVLQQQIRLLRGAVVYAPAALAYHLVNPTRFRRRYFVARSYGNGCSAALVAGLTLSVRAQRLVAALYTSLCSLLGLRKRKGLLTTLRRLAFAAGYLYESGVRLLASQPVSSNEVIHEKICNL